MNAPGGGRLASSLGTLKPEYDVIVVGSGYGGAVTAARLAEAGKSVCVLERGRELRPGDYPDTLRGALRELQLDLPGRHWFSRSALFDLRLNGDMNVLVGCGLGGTSLINANVALRPVTAIFRSDAWPARIRQEAGRDGSPLDKGFEAARKMLGVGLADHLARPRKLRMLDRIRDDRGECPEAPITVTLPGRGGDKFQPNPAGVMQHPCTGCGDCVSGCNYAAKNTLIMNYLPVARRHGAEIFTEMQVDRVEPFRNGGRHHARWRVHVEPVDSGRGRFSAGRLCVTARTVVLAAGTLGSTGILFRSDPEREKFSAMLGKKFSGNGDALAFSYNNKEPANAIGFGARSPHGWEAPGPCISGYLRRGDNILLQDGVIPGALSSILSAGFVAARFLTSRESPTPGMARGDSIWRALDRYVRGGAGATQTFLAMVEDPKHGELVEEGGRLRVRWPDAGMAPAYRELESWLIKESGRLGGSYVPSPFGRITVHPLGGCAMADDAGEGVVNDSGAVFTREGGIHDGLYVCDGSIVPRALGANPLFTITALAERAWPRILASLA